MYCLNLHPGESLSEVIDVLRGDVAAVKRAIAPEHSYEIGLRLGNRAAAPLPVAARHRGVWHGIVHTLRVLHAAALSAARCAVGPRTRRDVMSALPFTHAHYPGGAMGASRPTAITHAIFAHSSPVGAPDSRRRAIGRHPGRPKSLRPSAAIAADGRRGEKEMSSVSEG